MANGIRIDDLDATLLPSRDHVVPAMKDGLTVKLTVGQILDLLGKVLDPDEVGSKALFAALNLSDLDDPEQARENLGATEVGDALFTAASKEAARENIGATEIGHALFTAASKAAGRSAIDALGPDDLEYGSNANGEYVRSSNGLQICWKTVSVTTAVDIAIGGVFVSSSNAQLGDWPAAFISPPARVGLQRGSWGLYSGIAPTETSAGEVGFWRPTSAPSQTTEHDFVGIGRWF